MCLSRPSLALKKNFVGISSIYFGVRKPLSPQAVLRHWLHDDAPDRRTVTEPQHIIYHAIAQRPAVKKQCAAAHSKSFENVSAARKSWRKRVVGVADACVESVVMSLLLTACSQMIVNILQLKEDKRKSQKIDKKKPEGRSSAVAFTFKVWCYHRHYYGRP